MSWSAETASRMKSKLPACFFISSALRETTTSSAPRRSASSVLLGEVVKTTTCAPNASRELHAHVAQPAEPDHADLLALGDAPVTHRRVGRDSGAEQRRGPGEIEVGGDAQNEALIDDDAVGVAAVGDAAQVLVRGAVGEDLVRAELLEASPALGTGVVGVDQAADAREVARLELRNRRADLR